MNLLLLPWPDAGELKREHFRLAEPGAEIAPELPGRFKFFSFGCEGDEWDLYDEQSAEGATLTESDPSISRYEAQRRWEKRIDAAIEVATAEVGSIDAIVFPELSLSTWQARVAREKALGLDAVFIGGVRVDPRRTTPEFETEGIRGPAIVAVVDYSSWHQPSRSDGEESVVPPRLLVQPKHHRWCLDRSQILQYHLGGRLPAGFP